MTNEYSAAGLSPPTAAAEKMVAVAHYEDGDKELLPKYSDNGILLVPQPTNDPRDPLNWPRRKKHLMFAIMCFATFAGISAPASTAIANSAQGKTFGVSPQVVSWTIAGMLGGIIIGPFFFIPLARVIGMCSCSFWACVITTAFSIWSGVASGPNDLVLYAVSRGLAGITCAIPQILTTGYITQVYFIHERGHMFAIYSAIYALATVASSTFCGYIVDSTSWVVTFWWLVGANGISALLIFLFMEEPGFARPGSNSKPYPPRPTSYLASRVATFFSGHRVVPPVTFGELIAFLAKALAILVSPVTIFAGLFTMINFSWLVLVSIEWPILLLQPYRPARGLHGYGFSVLGVANIFYALWIGILVAQAYGILLHDRIPLLLAKRAGRPLATHPEYRLYPSVGNGLLILPWALGLFGAAAHEHLHWSVLAVAAGFIQFGASASIPVPINYVAECFPAYPQEVSAAMNAWRILLALVHPFYYELWEERVGLAWVWGTAGFLSLFGFGCVVVLMMWGDRLRSFSLVRD